MSLDREGDPLEVRPMVEDDLGSADAIMRLAFGTARGLPDPESTFGDRDIVRSRFRAAPDCAWVAELAGDVVGSVFAARWGSFGFFGPLSVHPDNWDRGIGGRLLQPVLASFTGWGVRQGGLFTFAASLKHLGLYQKHGFWPGALTLVTAKAAGLRSQGEYALFSDERSSGEGRLLEEAGALTDRVFPGLDLEREIRAVYAQGLGDTVLLRGAVTLEGMAVCHRGAGSEAGGDDCYVKFAAVLPGDGAGERFERLLDACEAFAERSGAARLTAGVNTGRLDAYRRLLARGFRAEQIGLSMFLRPAESRFDTTADYVLDDLR
jgi:N-acetylglutamate synthase-like GNAT family acetyltransferase